MTTMATPTAADDDDDDDNDVFMLIVYSRTNGRGRRTTPPAEEAFSGSRSWRWYICCFGASEIHFYREKDLA